MNTITHEGARDLIDRRLDERLKANQQTLLDDHLHSCETCRLYASEMDLVRTRLTQEFQARWDDDPGPSASLMDHITSRARRIPAANRFSSNVRFLSGAAALLLLALVVNFVVSKLQSTSASTNGTPTLSAPVNLTIDPQSCKPATDVSTPNELYGYDVIQNASLVEGDFTFDFWLYCDPSLNVNDQEHFSAVSGLGIYSSWRYKGPSVAGPVEYYYGFEENEVIGKSGSDGPLDQSSANGKFGINISEAVIRSYIQQGEPIQFHVTVNSSLGQNSAILSFHLEPTQSGLKVVDLQAHVPESLDNGLIAFNAASENGDLDIYTVRPDGSGLTNLTNSREDDYAPTWSPDGRRIAFVSRRDGNEEIYVMNADGSNPVRLTQDPNPDVNPVWSPDGTRIAYTSGNFSLNDTNIYVVDVNGQSRRLITDFAPKSIVFPRAWTPDGQFILFNVEGRIVQANTNGGEITPIAPKSQTNTDNYVLAKDGSTFSYLTQCNEGNSTFCYRLRSIRMDDAQPDFTNWLATFKTPEDICPVGPAATWMGSSIKWSPDQTKLLFIFTCEGSGWMYLANADGSDFRPLTNYPVIEHGSDNRAATGDWSPDSQSVVFMSVLDNAKGYNLYTLNIQEALRNPDIRPAPLNISASQISSPAWQPTSQSETVKQKPTPKPEQSVSASGLLAFVSEQTGNADIYTVRADGSELTNLTNSPAQDSNPIWSRDGRHIAFESKGNGFSQIYLMDADGSNLIQLTNDNADHSLSLNLDGKSNPWSPDGKNLFFLQGPSGGDIWELYVMGVDGQNKTLLASGRFSLNSISWSPDGKHIAYVLNEASNPNEAFVAGLYIIDSNGSNSRELKNYIPRGQNLGAPYYWSADRQSIIFTASSEHAKQETIYEFNLNSDSVLEKNSLPGVVDWQNDVSLTWEKDFVWHRSDGSTNTLAWDDSSCLVDITRSSHDNFAIGAYCPDSHKFKLYVANADGSVIKQLLDSPNIIGEIGELVWSQDDRYITFPIATGERTSLYILNVEAALNNPALEPEQIVIGRHDFLYDVPSWQPIVVEETGRKKPAPVPQAENRLIAFTSSPEGNSDIFIMNSDGSGVRNLTNNLATDRNPVWSPDGQKIAFESDRDGRFDVYMMNVDGSDPTRLTTDPAFDALAASYDSPWSPNGKQIIVQSNRSGKDALYVVPVEGNGEAIQISDTPGTIAWSPTGDQIAYSYVSEKSGLNNTGEHDAIRIVNVDGTNPRDIVQTGLIGDIHWSPDGTTIYYRNGAGLWVIERADAQGGKPETILSVEDSYFPGMAWFSPDSSIVYQSTDSQGQTSLYRWKKGIISLAAELFKPDPLEACETTPKESYITPGAVVSHDTKQAISYMNCESGQVVFILHHLTNNDSSILGRLLLVNPEIKVDWSQDDQVITIRVVQSDVSQSSGVQASLFVLYRNQLGQLPIVLTPVIEQTNGLIRTAIQPTP
ncbi:MAG: hypothetical protein ACM3Y8_02860 [Byssovorax cruenta]